jgi:hypothetical protein
MRIKNTIKNLEMTSIFMVSIFYVTSIGNPIPWICIVLVIILVKQKNTYELRKVR